MKGKLNQILAKLIFVFLTLFLGAITVDASCTHQQRADLNEIARNIRAAFEVNHRKETVIRVNEDNGDRYEEEIDVPEFVLTIYNITDDIVITKTNSHNDQTRTINYEMATNGTYSLTVKNLETVITYTLRITSNLEGCSGDVLRTFTVQKPRFNMFSTFEVCEGLENIPYCQPFVIDEFVDFNEGELPERIEKYLNENNLTPDGKEKAQNFGDWISKNLRYILTGVVIVGGITVVTTYIIKRRRMI